MLSVFDTLHIIPGLYCNYSCSHCANSSGPKETARLSKNELNEICLTVSKYKPKTLQFTGGEPTFYIDEINSIINSHSDINSCEVKLTTNGHFAKNYEEAENIICKFSKVDSILLSFDRFHSSQTDFVRLANLEKLCKDKNISFCISISITSPKEMLQAKKLFDDFNSNVIFQKIDSCGRAKDNNLSYQYPSFEKEVLSKKCPNIATMSFLPNVGFSTCCGNLIFNNADVARFSSNTLENYLNSDFYKTMSTKAFHEIINKKGLKIDYINSSLSSTCKLCENIWKE